MEEKVASRVLIIDDEEYVLKALVRALQDEDFEVFTAPNAEEALEMVQRHRFKVVISDERMPGMFGSELLSIISVRQPEVVKMLLTGYTSVEAAITAVNQGEVYRFLVKPWDDFELKMMIRGAIEKYDLEMKNRRLMALVRTQAYKLAHEKPARVAKGASEEQVVAALSAEEIAELMKECGIE